MSLVLGLVFKVKGHGCWCGFYRFTVSLHTPQHTQSRNTECECQCGLISHTDTRAMVPSVIYPTPNLIWLVRINLGLRHQVLDHLEVAFTGGKGHSSKPVLDDTPFGKHKSKHITSRKSEVQGKRVASHELGIRVGIQG